MSGYVPDVRDLFTIVVIIGVSSIHFLSNEVGMGSRSQVLAGYVICNDAKSDVIFVESGAPKGFILGPCFSVYS